MLKKDIPKVWSLLLLIAAVIVVACIASGCRAAKDNKAFTRIIASPKLAEKTFRELEKTRPCITRPVEIRKGKDSIIIDTAYDENVDYLNNVIDSLLSIECPQPTHFNLDSLKRKITAQVQKNCQPVYEYRLRVDTIMQEDVRRLELFKNDLLKAGVAADILNANLADERNRKNKWVLYFWLLVGLLILLIVLRTKKIL